MITWLYIVMELYGSVCSLHDDLSGLWRWLQVLQLSRHGDGGAATSPALKLGSNLLKCLALGLRHPEVREKGEDE